MVGNLRSAPGAELVAADGDRVVVLSALKTDRVEPTYNFEVGDFHERLGVARLLFQP